MNSVAGQQGLITLLPRLLYAACCRKKRPFLPVILSGRQEREKAELK